MLCAPASAPARRPCSRAPGARGHRQLRPCLLTAYASRRAWRPPPSRLAGTPPSPLRLGGAVAMSDGGPLPFRHVAVLRRHLVRRRRAQHQPTLPSGLTEVEQLSLALASQFALDIFTSIQQDFFSADQASMLSDARLEQLFLFQAAVFSAGGRARALVCSAPVPPWHVCTRRDQREPLAE